LNSEGENFQALMKQVAEFERQIGRAPTIRELAKLLAKKPSEVRQLVNKLVSEGETDGTSACTSSLKEILLGGRAQRFASSSLSNREIFLLDHDGAKIGVVPTEIARKLAKERDLDLFIVRHDSNPPVARLMDYEGFKFESEKRARETKANHHVVTIKKLRLSSGIAAKDYQVKLRSAQNFLQDGDKVSISVTLQDSQASHTAFAFALLNRFAADLHQFALVSEEPRLEKRTVTIILVPVL
jgi:translation initiation factor IF-3